MKFRRSFGIWLFVTALILAGPVVSLLLVQVSPVQQFLKEKVAIYISQQTGMSIEIQKVNAIMPYYFRVEGLRIEDHHDQLMLESSILSITLSSLDIRQRVVRIGSLSMQDFYLNHEIYDGEDINNLSLFLERLGSDDPKEKSDKEPFIIRVNNITIKNGEYKSRLRNPKVNQPGIDFNNLHLRNINAGFSNISIMGQVISLNINEFNTHDKSGLRITRLSTLADISPTSIRLRTLNLETNQTAITLDLSFHYQSFEDFKDFENKVLIRSEIGVTTLSTYDLGFFVPSFYLTNNQINLKGSLEGFISSFETKEFQFSIGSTSFDGDISMDGLPDFEKTYITLDINHLVADPSDIGRFHLNDKGTLTSIPLPDMIKNLGMVSINGQFNGTYKDFYTNAGFSGTFGYIQADMRLAQVRNTFTVAGALGLEQVDAGKIINYSELGLVNMNVRLAGSGTAENWDIDIVGLVHSLEFMGYSYEKIDLNGKVIDKMFQGLVSIEDKNIVLDFNGILDFNTDIPSYNFIAEINNANLANLGLLSDSARGLLSTRMSIDVQGNNADNLAGLVKIDFAEFKTPTRNYQLSHFDLSAFSSPDNRRKFIALRSDYLDGDIHGNFSFADLGRSITEFSSTFLSSVIETSYDDDIDSLLIRQNDIHFDFTFKNTGNLTDLLTGTRIETTKLNINGSFLSISRSLRVGGVAEQIYVNGIKVENWRLNVHNEPENLIVRTGAETIFFYDTIGIYEPVWHGNISNNIVNSVLAWSFEPYNFIPEASVSSTFNLQDYPDFNLTFTDGSVKIQDTVWSIRQGSGLSYINNILMINNFAFFNDQQSIVIDSKNANKDDNPIEVSFKGIDLSWIDFLTLPYMVDLDGIIDGNISVSNLWDNPLILADLSIDNFAYNDDPMGSVKLISVWDDNVKGMRISADFIYHGNVGAKKTAEISGYLYPLEKKKDNFDLAIDLDNFRINVLSVMLSDISSDIRGFASGKLFLKGPFSAPELTGKLKVNARNVFVDYLNTSYSFADSITFEKNAIIFNNIQLSDNNRLSTRDPYSGVLSGSIGHRGFKEFTLNLSVRAENFTFLNTNGQQDPMYFGRALATGNVSINGPVDDIMITVHAKTERNTVLEIPLTYASEVTKSSFITFIDRQDGEVVIPPYSRRLDESNLRLNFNLQVTPDATVRLVFDPLVGDVIEGSGSGNLLMNIDSKGEFDLRGQYVIARGDYLFNIENLISKRFSVKSGGTIRWTGDPYDAIVDLEAVYSTKASLAPLNIEDSARGSQSVDCVIHMTDKLFNPTIDFSIDFPDLNSFDNEKYKALVKPNLNYHFLSLLAINRFVNPQSQQFLEAGSSANIAGANTTELLSNQLSVWLSNISDEFDVDFAYHPGSGLTPEQVEAAIKTQVLNDRLTIESRVGIGGKTYADNPQRTSNMVGDIIAEYRIDKEGRFRIKAFNQYNEQSILYEGAPYTQGLGVFYRKEFDTIRDLFRKKRDEQQR